MGGDVSKTKEKGGGGRGKKYRDHRDRTEKEASRKKKKDDAFSMQKESELRRGEKKNLVEKGTRGLKGEKNTWKYQKGGKVAPAR